jgi:hypothetical protein
MAVRLECGQLPRRSATQLIGRRHHMNDLGRIEDLPQDYVQDLRDLNLVPL